MAVRRASGEKAGTMVPASGQAAIISFWPLVSVAMTPSPQRRYSKILLVAVRSRFWQWGISRARPRSNCAVTAGSSALETGAMTRTWGRIF